MGEGLRKKSALSPFLFAALMDRLTHDVRQEMDGRTRNVYISGTDQVVREARLMCLDMCRGGIVTYWKKDVE